MGNEEITEITIRVLSAMVGCPPESLDEGTRLVVGLGLTSRNALELVMLLEDELGADLRIGTFDWRHLETVGTLTAYVTDQLTRS
jgi:acyl carrier protein